MLMPDWKISRYSAWLAFLVAALQMVCSSALGQSALPSQESGVSETGAQQFGEGMQVDRNVYVGSGRGGWTPMYVRLDSIPFPADSVFDVDQSLYRVLDADGNWRYVNQNGEQEDLERVVAADLDGESKSEAAVFFKEVAHHVGFPNELTHLGLGAIELRFHISVVVEADGSLSNLRLLGSSHLVSPSLEQLYPLEMRLPNPGGKRFELLSSLMGKVCMCGVKREKRNLGYEVKLHQAGEQ